MAKGATSKRKREDENRQTQQRQEETRQRQQRTQRETANSRQTTRQREAAPQAIPVLEERPTSRKTASGRNVADMFPEVQIPQSTNIPKVEPIQTNNNGQGFASDIEQRMYENYNYGTPLKRDDQGIRKDAEERIKASDASQYGAERAEKPQMEEYPSTAEKGRKMARERAEEQGLTMPSDKKGEYQGGGGGRSFEKESNLSDIGQQTVDDINKKIDRLGVIPTGTLGAVDQKMSELYDEADTIRALDNLSMNEKMDYLLDPEHRMSKSEQDYAKSLFDEYLENNPKARELNRANNPTMANSIRSQMTDEEQAEYDRMWKLGGKASDLAAYGTGVVAKAPGAVWSLDKLSKSLGYGDNNFSNNLEMVKNQSPIAEGLGEFTTTSAEYAMLQGLLEGAPGLVSATNNFGTSLAGGNAALGNAIGSVIRGTMADIPLDTVSNVIIPGLQQGKSLGEITLDSAKNIGENTFFNGATEFIPYLLKGARSVADNEVDDIIDAIRQNEVDPDALVKQNKIDADQVVDNINRTDDSINTRDLRTHIDSEGNGVATDIANRIKGTKMVDDNNNLKAMYHGTNSDFDSFKSGNTFFTDAPDVAQSYTGNGNVHKAYLDIKNPLVIEGNGKNWADLDWTPEESSEMNGLLEKINAYEKRIEIGENLSNSELVDYDNAVSTYNALEDKINAYGDISNTEGIAKYAADHGYDGVIINDVIDVGSHGDETIPSTVAIVTDPKQIVDANSKTNLAEPNIHDFGTGEQKVDSYRSNTMNKVDTVNEGNLPSENYTHNVWSEEDQSRVGHQRWDNNPNAVNELTAADHWDAADARWVQDKWQELMEKGDEESLRLADRLTRKQSYELREGGRLIQTADAIKADTVAGKVAKAKQLINKAVDAKRGAGTSEALDNFIMQLESELQKKGLLDYNLQLFGGKEPIQIVQDMMKKGMGAYAPTNANIGSKEFSGVNKILEQLQNGKIKNMDELANAIYKQNGGVNISASNQKKIFDYLTDASKLQEGTYEQELLLGKAAKLAMQDVPVSVGQKIRSILYANMLGNFKTAVSRNIAGNAAYNVLEQTRQPLAAGVDALTSLATKKRSTLGWNADKFKAFGQGFVKGTVDELKDIKNGINTGRNGSMGWENALKENSSIWREGTDSKVRNGLAKMANDTTFYVSNAMKLGDRNFFEANFAQRRTELHQLLDRYGKEGVAGLAGVPDEALDDTINMISALHAADAVFQKQGHMSQGLSKIRDGLADVSRGVFGVDILSTSASPFTMTPGNMIEKTIEYSPLGLVKNAVNTTKELANGRFNQRRFVDETSRNLMSIPVLGGAYGLAKTGHVNNGYSKDEDERSAQMSDGFIEYGLKIGDKAYDTSDLPVFGPQLQAAAAIAENGLNPESLGQAIEAVTAGSAMQGYRKLFGADNSYNSSLPDSVKNTVLSAGTQLVPALVRQLAQTTDEYKRDMGEYGTPQYYINQIKNTIPGLRETLPIKYDDEGNPVLQNQGRSLGNKILENFILPMNVSEYQPSELTNEAIRLKADTDNAAGFVPHAKRSDVKDWFDGLGREYSEEDFYNYKKDLGTLNSEAGNAIMQSDYYQSLDSFGQVKMLSDAYSAMKQVAKQNLTGVETDDKAALAYINGDVEGLINYLSGKDMLKGSGASSTSNAGKAVTEKANEGNLEGAQALADNLKVLVDMGVPSKGQGTYANSAPSYLGEIDPNEYATNWKEINTSGNDQISQDEMMEYFKENESDFKEDENYDIEKMLEYWGGYVTGFDPEKNVIPYVKDDGTIGKHKLADASDEEIELFNSIIERNGGDYRYVRPTDEETESSEAEEETDNNSFEGWLTQATNNRKQDEITTLDPAYQPGAPISTEDALTQIANTGIKTTAPEAYWNQAYGVDQTLTPEQFAQTWYAIDSALGEANGSHSKKEWAAFLNNNNLDEAEDRKLIEMYYNTGWNPLRYSDGKWYDK